MLSRSKQMEAIPIACLIFDCDGVLFDSRAANVAFYNRILSQLSLPLLSEEEVQYVHVSTAEGALRYLLAKRCPQKMEEILANRPRIDYTPFIRLMQVEPHLRELLRALPRRIKRAVSTNRSYTIGEVLRAHGLDGEFDLVVSALDVENPKPHPEPIIKVLQHFSIPPAAAIFVGDALSDQQAARGAGVPFVAYKNHSLQADYHIDDLIQLKEIISPPMGIYEG